MILAWTVVVGLAGFRLWRMVAVDTITAGPRNWLIVNDHRFAQWAAEGLVCPWCAGWWTTGMVTAAASVVNGWGVITTGLVWLAASTVAGVAARVAGDA
jgi:hypothetical protein